MIHHAHSPILGSIYYFEDIKENRQTKRAKKKVSKKRRKYFKNG
ncbi:hypothetical protein Phi46:1_gp13 [Cellulophaga phage phi46:1]|nr:hypothetical protein Phi46:1_gp13 [Cellulophaga phage phi46:1]AGO47824.1 hypothetical protein Phi46:1_gp13 [Cellulophaga phage phi46:1]